MGNIKYHLFNEIPYEAHKIVFDLIKPNKTILDIGCAVGYFAEKLKEKGCTTYGIEIDKAAAQRAKKFCKKVYISDVTNIHKLKISRGFFDYILLLDILEHLENPQSVLKEIKKFLKTNGEVIISMPNFAHISVRVGLLFGRFNYSEFGILDKNHLRFFTKNSFLELIKTADLKVEKLDYSADFGQIPFFGRILKKLDKKVQYLITRIFNSLLGVQFIAVCIS